MSEQSEQPEQSELSQQSRRSLADFRLALPAAAAWAGAIALVSFPASALAHLVVTACCFVGAAGLLCAVRLSGRVWPRRLLPQLALCLIALALVSSRVSMEQDARTPSQLTHAAETAQRIDVALVITSAPVATKAGVGDTWRVYATATRLWTAVDADSAVGIDMPGRGSGVGVNAPVVVMGTSEHLSGLVIGSRVSALVTVRETEPGDQRSFLMYLSVGEIFAEKPSAPVSWVNELRASFSSFAEKLPGPGGELLPGLAIGDTGLVSQSLDQDMKDSSLSHLTAVSGANCAIVTGLIIGLSGRLGLLRRGRAAAATIALACFVVLVTPDPSVLRAACMSLVVMVSLLTGRPGRGLSALSCAVILLLTIDPWMSRNYGFVLSVLATGGILLITPIIVRILGRYFPAWIALLLAVPAAAQLACQPVLIMLQPQIPLVGVLANVVAGPAAPIATILGLLACLAMPLAPELGEFIGWLAWWPSSWIGHVAQVSASIPGAQLPWVSGFQGAVLVALAIGCMVFAIWANQPVKQQASKPAPLPASGSGDKTDISITSARGSRKLRRQPRRQPRRFVPLALAVSAVVCGLSIGLASGPGIVAYISRPRDWAYAMCDIGQGDALLVNTGGPIIMVDVGPDPEAAASCLSLMGVDHIDLLVLTHYDLDHVGGLSGVSDRVSEAIVSPRTETKDDPTLAELSRAGVNTREGFAGMTGSTGGATWRVLNPSFDPITETDTAADIDARAQLATQFGSNDRSVILELLLEQPGKKLSHAIFLGDLGEEGQRQIMRQPDLALTPVDVVKVAHHGSRDQYPELYRQLSATFALLSVGIDNRYGHPTASNLQTLEECGSVVLRTDLMGAVVLSLPHEADGSDESAQESDRSTGWGIWHERLSSPAEPAAPTEPK